MNKFETTQPITSETANNDKRLDFLKKEVEVAHGLKERIKTTIERHWGDKIPLLHFTNSEASWGKGLPLTTTGFVESITRDGFRNFSNFGYIPDESDRENLIKWYSARNPNLDLSHINLQEARSNPILYLQALDRLRVEFIHHGLRVNKNKVKGTISVPAVFIVDKKNIATQPGYDSVVHTQANAPIPRESIIGIFNFDPDSIIKTFVSTGHPTPIELKSQKKAMRNVPFGSELSGRDRKIRNTFLKELIHTVGISRLIELKAIYELYDDPNLKSEIALAAHDLVDSYFVTTTDYDEIFDKTSINIRETIEKRRNKYNLFNNS